MKNRKIQKSQSWTFWMKFLEKLLEVGASQKSIQTKNNTDKDMSWGVCFAHTPSFLPLFKHFSLLVKIFHIKKSQMFQQEHLHYSHVFQVSSISGIAAIYTPHCNLRQNRGVVWNFTGVSVYVCVYTCVCDWLLGSACAISLYPFVCIGDMVVLL